jgi:HlyD family secretion protein
MKKKTIIWLAVVAIVAAGITIYFITRKKTVPVTFVTVEATNGYIAKSVTATGTLQPVDTVSVGAQVSGLVKSIFADFNSIVKKGQLLAQIEPNIIKAQSEESRANLATAVSALNYQKVNYERQDKLFKLGAISQADYQLATNQYQSAKAAVNNVQAQLKITLQTLSYTNIYSPIDGTVLNRNVSAGQTIASSFSAPTLFVIAKDLTRMQVRAAVDEADIGGVLAGQNVSFTVDAFPEDIFRGKVQEILLHATISSNVVTYTTLINVDNKNLKLKPGMTASINIFSEEDSNALLIPARALTFKPDSVLLSHYKIIRLPKNAVTAKANKEKIINANDSANSVSEEKEAIIQSHVWVKTGDTLTQKRIVTGLNDDTNVKVISGLSPDDEVVTSAVAGATKATADVTTKSPFMPSMGRKKTTSTTTPKN